MDVTFIRISTIIHTSQNMEEFGSVPSVSLKVGGWKDGHGTVLLSAKSVE